MSRIYFHALDGEATVRGWERAMFGGFCNDLMLIALAPVIADTIERPSPLRKLLPADCYVLNSNPFPVTQGFFEESRFTKDIKLWLRVNLGDEALTVNGRKLEIFSLALNTALAVGCDFVKLAARLHGQCEIHTYVEGENRAWLAGIIEQGRAAEFLRADSGWEDAIKLLRQNDQNPVVTSYSVTEQFPNYYMTPDIRPYPSDPAEQEEWEAGRDAWYDLPEEKKWELAMAGLRAKAEGSKLEMRPETWNKFTFTHGINAYQLSAMLHESEEKEQAHAPLQD